MYYFVEYMRARAALRIALIILALLLLTGIILRIAVRGPTPFDVSATLQREPGARVSHTQLADGTVRTIVDNPERRTYAVIEQHGGSLRMDITQPVGMSNASNIMSLGSMSIKEDVHKGIVHTAIVYRESSPWDLGVLLLITIPMGLIIGTVLGGPLSKENDGHLELAWTKPVSRDRYALACVGVDAVTIFASQILMLATVLLASMLFGFPRLSVTGSVGLEILLAAFGPLAWYALLTAGSASVKRGPWRVIGIGWLIAIIVPALSGALRDAANYNTVAAAFHAVFHALSFLDPISFMTFQVMHGDTTVLSAVGTNLSTSVSIVIALSIVYITAAVLQWRRVEA